MRTIGRIRAYHDEIKSTTVVKICDAILDKMYGMGLLWISANFEEWFAELEQYPPTWVIAQDRDSLREIYDKLLLQEKSPDK